MATLQVGAKGTEVKELQQKLKELGFNPGKVDGDFGTGTRAAVVAFQKSQGLEETGVVDMQTLGAIGAARPAPLPIAAVTVSKVANMFPRTPADNIRKHLPPVLQALVDEDLAYKEMILMALATIRAESEGFEPISEYQSRYNTSPDGHAFDLYDDREDIGNRGKPDGERFKGRGFVQLTGRFNYEKYSKALGMGTELVDNPDLANDPVIAGKLLAKFLKDKEPRIKKALEERDLKTARRAVNGGSHGLNRFTQAFEIGEEHIA